MMRSFILLIGIMVIAGAAHAADYEWTDSQGGLHFTDDHDNIPAKYRKKAWEVSLAPEIDAPSQPQNQIVSPATRENEASFGGHDESWWRSNFKQPLSQIKYVQERLVRERDKLTKLEHQKAAILSKTVIDAYNSQVREITRDEAWLTDLQKKLADLDNKAARAAVPIEWRK